MKPCKDDMQRSVNASLSAQDLYLIGAGILIALAIGGLLFVLFGLIFFF